MTEPTRPDAGLPAPASPPPDEEDERERRNTNIALAVFFVLVLGAGYWLVDALLAARRADDCIAQGRRNCSAPLDVPARDR